MRRSVYKSVLMLLERVARLQKAHCLMKVVSNDRGASLIIVVMVMTVLLSVIGAGQMFTGLDLRMTANYKAGTQAFYAADSGVNIGVNQISMNQNAATAAFSGTLSGGLSYRSGPRNAPNDEPQPLTFLRTRTESGYSIVSGTGYNPSGYAFHDYQFSVTGKGPIGAAREIEAQAGYGPAPN